MNGSTVLHITPWERSALESLANGFSTAQLATTLGLAECEIDQRLAALLHKMGVASRTEAIRIAWRRGLIPAAPGPDVLLL